MGSSGGLCLERLQVFLRGLVLRIECRMRVRVQAIWQKGSQGLPGNIVASEKPEMALFEGCNMCVLLATALNHAYPPTRYAYAQGAVLHAPSETPHAEP